MNKRDLVAAFSFIVLLAGFVAAQTASEPSLEGQRQADFAPRRPSRTEETKVMKFRPLAAPNPAAASPAPSGASAGTWTPLTNAAPGNVELMLLLPDGTVMAAESDIGAPSFAVSKKWHRLTPDSHGSYANGTWTTLQSMIDTRLFYCSYVLPSGKIFVAGGEYGTGGAKGEVYNPLTNSWTAAPVPTSLIDPTQPWPGNSTYKQAISDGGGVILPDGKILIAPVLYKTAGQTLLYDPSTNAWSAGPNYLGGSQDEATWLKMPDNSILTVDMDTVNSERYVPSSNSWITDADLANPIYGVGSEVGPAFLLPPDATHPRGSGFFVGANGQSALYAPSGSNVNGIWSAGAASPNVIQYTEDKDGKQVTTSPLLTSGAAPDAPGAMMANGRILCALSGALYNDSRCGTNVPGDTNGFWLKATNPRYPSPTTFFEYDPSTNSYTSINGPTGTTDNRAAYQCAMLDLPDGTVLFAHQRTDLYIYTPNGAPTAAGKPTITTFTKNQDGSYHLVGKGLNGISQGAAYGDDMQMDTNYPIVRLTSGTNVYYARTYNWSSTGVLTGQTPVTTEFAVPAGLPAGNYNMVVVANGIASDAVTFSTTVPPPVVTVTEPIHNSTAMTFSGIKGTATDNNGPGIAGNTINFTLYHVNSGEYWNGSGWGATQVQFSVGVDPNTNIWSYTGGLPKDSDGTLRNGQYALSASTHDLNGLNSVPQSGVNNIFFYIDIAPPTVGISSPVNQSVITDSSYSFNGTANDDQGVNRVILFIRRNSDNTYWNGSGWVSDGTQANLSSTYNSSDHSWNSNVTLPVPGGSMANGSYNFQALAIDNAGNSTFATADVSVLFVVKWTGATLRDTDPNNNSTDWSTAANWSTNFVPGPNDIVQIDNGDTVTSTVNRTVRGLRFKAGTLSGYTVTVTGAGTSAWSGGVISTNLVISPGASLTVNTTAGPYLNTGNITNAGTIVVTTTDPNNPGFWFGHNSTITNQSGGRIEIARDGQALLNLGSAPVITNQSNGTIVKTTAASGLTSIDWVLDNNGVVQSDAGTLSWSGGSSSAGSSGTFNTTTASARIQFSGGTQILNSGARFTGSGRGRITTGNIAVAGAATVGTAGQAAGGFEQTGGNLYGVGSLSVIGGGGTCTWTGGLVSTNYNIGAGATLTVDTTAEPYLNTGNITNAGTIIVTAPNPNSPGFWNGHNSTLVNQNGGVIQITRDGTFARNLGSNPLITNQSGGIIVKTTAASGSSATDWALDNNGIVQADAGTLAWFAGSSAAGSAGIFNTSAPTARIEFGGGTHTLKDGARFTGPGRGRITNATLTLAGAVTVGTAGAPAGGFEQTGGNLNGPGSLSVLGGAGICTWSGGLVSTNYSIGAGATLTIDTTAEPYLNTGAIMNAGTIIVTAPNPNSPGFWNGHNSTLVNQSGGVIQIARDGTFARNLGSNPLITNQSGGTIVKTAAASGSSATDWALDNNGIVQCDAGTLAWYAGSSPAGSAGTFNTTAASARIEFGGGTQILNTGARFIGPGRGRITTGSIAVAGAATVGTTNQAAGGFEQTGGNLYGAGSLSVIGGGGTCTWSGGLVSTNYSIGSGATLTIDTTAEPYLNTGAITNAGTIIVTAPNPNSPGYWNGHNSTLTNQSGGVIQIARDGLFARNLGSNPLITNQSGGTIIKTAAASGSSGTDWVLDNNGTVQSDAGTLAWYAGSSAAGSTGVFKMNAAAARVEFAGGTHILKTGTIFTGAGRARLTNGALSISGNITLGGSGSSTGGFEMTGGSITGGNGSVLNHLMGGTFAWSAGTISTTLNISNGTTLAIDTSAYPFMDSGTLNNTGLVVFSSPDSSGGFDGNSSLLKNLPGGRMEFARDGYVFRNRGTTPILVNQGTIVKTKGTGTTFFTDFSFQNAANASIGADLGTLTFGSSATFDNGSNLTGPGRIDMQNNSTFGGQMNFYAELHFNSGGTMTFNNATLLNIGNGTMQWDTGLFTGNVAIASGSAMTIQTSGGPYFDSGTFSNSGTLTVNGTGGNFDGGNATFTNQAGGLWQFVGSANLRNRSPLPTFVNNGTVRILGPSNVVNSDWNFTQSSGGILDLQVAGNAPAQFSRLLVGGTATLGGTINANLLNGYLPNGGDAFPLVSYNSSSGQFANVHAPGFKFSMAYGANSFSLVAVSQPTLAEWKQSYFGDPNSPQAADTAAPAGDSISNLMKYALGLNPMLSGASGLPTLAANGSAGAGTDRASMSAAGHPTYSFQRVEPAGVTFIVQASNNVGNASSWTEIARLSPGSSVWSGTATVTEVGTGSTRSVIVSDSSTLTTAPRRFYRLLVAN